MNTDRSILSFLTYKLANIGIVCIYIKSVDKRERVHVETKCKCIDCVTNDDIGERCNTVFGKMYGQYIVDSIEINITFKFPKHSLGSTSPLY